MRVIISPIRSGAGGNPYVEHLCAGIAASGVDVRDYRRRDLASGADAVHVNWPAFLVRWDTRAHAVADATKTLGYLAAARARGTRIVWTAHDLGAHDRPFPRLQRAYELAFAALVTDVVSLSRAAVPMLRRRFPPLTRTPVHVVPHGHYRDDYPDVGGDRGQARRELGLDPQAPLVLAFGMLRRYKATEHMVAEFGRLAAPGARLLVVGESRDAAYTREVEEAVRRTPGVDLRAERVDEETAARLFTAADVVYAAYPAGTSLNSGVAVLALSFDRPVVVRDTPVMAELADLVGPGWVFRAGDGDDVAALSAALDRARAGAGRVELGALDWERITAAVVAIYAGEPLESPL